MIRHRHLLICAVWLLLVHGLRAQSIQITNAEGHTTTLTATQIANVPHITVSVTDHDKPAQFEGVPLSAVLSMAAVSLGDRLRGARMAEVLLVSAADGYRAAFALAEADPAFAVREIILADKRDGKPLDSREGPFRIVAPGDKRPARWIRQVTEMKIVAIK